MYNNEVPQKMAERRAKMRSVHRKPTAGRSALRTRGKMKLRRRVSWDLKSVEVERTRLLQLQQRCSRQPGLDGRRTIR